MNCKVASKRFANSGILSLKGEGIAELANAFIICLGDQVQNILLQYLCEDGPCKNLILNVLIQLTSFKDKYQVDEY
jgi:hypothetical protein